VPALQVSFKDEGIGIPEKELEVIFNKFIQSSKSRSDAGGTGLGLAICQEIVRGHQGSLIARNNPEVGSTFMVELPVSYDKKIPTIIFESE